MAGGWINFRSNRKLARLRGWALDTTNYVDWYDDFLGDTINLDLWTTSADTGCTAAAINVQAGGVARMTTDTTDDDRVDMGGPLIFLPSNGAIWFETRVKNTLVTNSGMNAGMIDASTEASQVMAFAVSGTTWTTTPVDGVAFAYDIDATTDVWYGIGVKANTDIANVAGSVPVLSVYDKLGILISTTGDAAFWQNDVLIGGKANATTATTPLAPYVSVINRGAAARSMDIDYVHVVQFLNR